MSHWCYCHTPPPSPVLPLPQPSTQRSGPTVSSARPAPYRPSRLVICKSIHVTKSISGPRRSSRSPASPAPRQRWRAPLPAQLRLALGALDQQSLPLDGRVPLPPAWSPKLAGPGADTHPVTTHGDKTSALQPQAPVTPRQAVDWPSTLYSSEGIESHSVFAPSRVTMNSGRDRRTCPTNCPRKTTPGSSGPA